MSFRDFLNALLAIAAITTAATAEQSIDARLADDRPVIIAHRSAIIDGLPENSIAWVEAAIAHDVEMVHINPQLTSDGHYVLMHDPTLNRTTNVVQTYPEGPPNGPGRDARGGKDYLRDYTLAEIQKLQLIGTDQAPPSLANALDASRDAFALVGLKNYEIDSLAAVLAPRDTSNLLFFELYHSGTDPTKLRELGERSGVGIAVTLFNTRDALKDLNAIHDQLGPVLTLVSVTSSRVTPEFLTRARVLNLHVGISGRGRPEDSDLANKGDATRWLTLLERVDAVSTGHSVKLIRALQ